MGNGLPTARILACRDPSSGPAEPALDIPQVRVEDEDEAITRVVYLTDRALAVTKRLMFPHPQGPLFRNGYLPQELSSFLKEFVKRERFPSSLVRTDSALRCRIFGVIVVVGYLLSV